MSADLMISIAAEPIAHLGGVAITNSLLTSWIVVGSLCLLAMKARRSLSLVPSIGQLLIELPIESLYSLSRNIAGQKAIVFFPYVATFFLFILLSNWAGLIPGVGTILIKQGAHQVPLFRAPTSDLNTTIALSLTTVGLIQFFGLKSLGFKYLKKFFSFKNPLFTFVGLLELISEIAKIISFAFRLFGNIFAGEVLLLVTSSLVAIIAPIPFYGLELFVGFIQALVFAMLTLVFLNLASSPAEH